VRASTTLVVVEWCLYHKSGTRNKTYDTLHFLDMTLIL